MLTDGRTDTTKLIDAFRYFANALIRFVVELSLMSQKIHEDWSMFFIKLSRQINILDK